MIVYLLTKLELGGAQKVCLTLMQAFAQTTKTALISGNQGPLVNYTNIFDRVFLLDSMQREVGLGGLVREVKNFFAIIKILRRLKKEDPDLILHTHSTKAGIVGRWAALFAGVKNRVHTIHGYSFNQFMPWPIWLLHYLAELITSPLTTKFVCVSQADYDTGKRLFPRFAKKATIIRAAVDASHFTTAPQDFTPAYRLDRPFVIGTISCFKPQKNLFDLLGAFATVHQKLTALNCPAPRLELVGDGAQGDALKDWVIRHGLAGSVVFWGWQDNVTPILKTWDVFTLSSLWEGLPCSVIEARLCKLPVVAYNVGGIAEVIRDGKNGYVIPAGNQSRLASHLLLLAENPELRHTLADYHDNLEEFDNKTMVKMHTTLYNSLLSTKLLKRENSDS